MAKKYKYQVFTPSGVVLPKEHITYSPPAGKTERQEFKIPQVKERQEKQPRIQKCTQCLKKTYLAGMTTEGWRALCFDCLADYTKNLRQEGLI